MNTELITNLVLGLAAIVLPIIVAQIKESKRIPKYVKPWIDQITDADVLEAIAEAEKIAKLNKQERLAYASKYLQERIDALPTAAANWAIQDAYTRGKK